MTVCSVHTERIKTTWNTLLKMNVEQQCNSTSKRIPHCTMNMRISMQIKRLQAIFTVVHVIRNGCFESKLMCRLIVHVGQTQSNRQWKRTSKIGHVILVQRYF